MVGAACGYGEHPTPEGRLAAAGPRSVLALRPHRGTWRFVGDEAHPPAFTPAAAARRRPKAQRRPTDQGRRTPRRDSHGQAPVRSVAERELGPASGPTRGGRLVAATDAPLPLEADATWFMATNLPGAEAAAAAVARLSRLRDWLEPSYKPAKHEPGWAGFQVRPERAPVRHWHLVLLAFTRRLLAGSDASTATAPPAAALGPPTTAAPPPAAAPPPPGGIRGESARPRLGWQATLRRGRSWRGPWARLQLSWGQWSTAPPPPERAALLAHVAPSRPLDAPT